MQTVRANEEDTLTPFSFRAPIQRFEYDYCYTIPVAKDKRPNGEGLANV